jgi:hypothetical protein
MADTKPSKPATPPETTPAPAPTPNVITPEEVALLRQLLRPEFFAGLKALAEEQQKKRAAEKAQVEMWQELRDRARLADAPPDPDFAVSGLTPDGYCTLCGGRHVGGPRGPWCHARRYEDTLPRDNPTEVVDAAPAPAATAAPANHPIPAPPA